LFRGKLPTFPNSFCSQSTSSSTVRRDSAQHELNEGVVRKIIKEELEKERPILLKEYKVLLEKALGKVIFIILFSC
jgi:Fe2+ transport system protein B